MAKFCELGVESDVVIGKGIDIEDLFGRRILIEKVIIQPTKFPGKNSSGLSETNLPSMNASRAEKGLPPIRLYPIDTTIVKVGKCFQFT